MFLTRDTLCSPQSPVAVPTSADMLRFSLTLVFFRSLLHTVHTELSRPTPISVGLGGRTREPYNDA